MFSIFIDNCKISWKPNGSALLGCRLLQFDEKNCGFFCRKKNRENPNDSAFVTVILGIFMAGWIIKNSFSAWEEHPVVTSVMQKSIEEINFPAITICPLDDTRFGYLEEHLNSEENSEISIENLVTDLARVLYARHPTGIWIFAPKNNSGFQTFFKM